MFSLRKPVHRTSRVVTIGAASIGVASLALSGGAVRAATLFFDPGATTNPPSGGSGTFSNSSGNFSNLTTTGLSPAAGTNANYHTDGDTVQFTGTGGTVTVNGGTTVHSMIINPLTGDYNFSNGSYFQVMNSSFSAYDGPLGVRSYAALPAPTLSSLAGNNTINGTLVLGYGNGAQTDGINVGAGSTLTINNLVRGKSNGFAKTGAGLLRVNGTIGAQYAEPRIQIHGGTFEFNGTTSSAGYGRIHWLTVVGGTLSGTAAMERFQGHNWVAVGISEPSAQFEIKNGATFAPGSVATPVGTFSIKGARRFGTRADFETGSHFAIDLVSPDSAPGVNDGVHDVFKYSGGTYGLFGAPTSVTDNILRIYSGAIVDINGGAGTLNPGTYHIIQLFKDTSPDGDNITRTVGLEHDVNNGFVIGNAPTGYTYTFVNAASTGQNNAGFNGIDLVVAIAGGIDATWAVNVDGNWSTLLNWTGGVPNAAGSTARFTGNTLAAVNVDAPQTVGRILITGATNYTISGSPITLNNTGGIGANMVIDSAGGTQVINSNLVTTAGTVDVTVSGGSLTLGGAISGPAAMTKAGAGTLLLNGNSAGYTSTVTVNAGTVGGGGTLGGTVAAGSGAHTIAPSATLSSSSATTMTVGGLTTNANTTLGFNLVTPGASSVNDKIVVTGSGALTLNGGTLAITGNSVGAASLGYYKAIQYSGSIGGTGIAGITLPAVVNNIDYRFDTTHDAGFIDIHRGFMGDANDDGTVNFADFLILSQNFGASGGWSQADFINNGTIDFNDFLILSQNFGQTIGVSQLTATSDEIAQFQAASSAFLASVGVPEPASLALMGLGAVAMLVRRRKQA